MVHGGDIYSGKIEYDFSVNLNPCDCSEVTERILKDSRSRIGQYPDPLQREFRKAVAAAEGVSPEEVFGGNGASEILYALAAMINPNRVMLLWPCFGGYRHALSTRLNCETIEYVLKEDNEYLPEGGFLEALKTEAKHGLDLLILANPNNPSGRNIPRDILIGAYEICRKNKVRIIIDECFLRMSTEASSMIPYIREYNGLFVVNAFTKLFAIPGIRVGYVISDKGNIAGLSSFLPEWNMSVIAQTAGVVCSEYLMDSDWVMRTINVIEEEKEYLSRELIGLGFEVFKSDTSFILLRSDKDLYEYLKERRILIRDCADFKGLGPNFYRIAVKDHRQNEILIQQLTKLVRG